jgi:hypothetical protein
MRMHIQIKYTRIKKAIDKVKDDLLQALRKDKQQRQHAFMKGAQFVKKMLRGE